MATRKLCLSTTLQDDAGVKTPQNVYFTTDDASTLAQLITYAQSIMTDLDPVTDSLLIKGRLWVDVAVPGGLKVAPVDGGDNEETGLFTLSLTATPSKSFGVDVPAIPNSKLEADGKTINQADTDIAAWITKLTSSGTGTPTDSVWSSAFSDVRRALKTFRKHRRALRRTG